MQNSIPSTDILQFLHLCGFTWRDLSPRKTTQVQKSKNINARDTILHFCIHLFQVNNNLHEIGDKKHIIMVNFGYKIKRPDQVKPHKCALFCHLCGFT